jgi:hypothetical protein
MEFPVMSRASGQARPSVHRFSGTATAAMARTFAAWSRVRRTSSQPPTPARCCSTGTYSNARPRTGLPGMRAVSSQLDPHAGSILTGRALGVS